MLTGAGLTLAALMPGERFGELLAGIGGAFGAIEIALIMSARASARRAVDSLIDQGFIVGRDSHAMRLVAARMRDLGEASTRYRLSAALRDALVDAARPRSSNPIVLAGRRIVLTQGTALALLAERDLVLRIADDLERQDTNPRAIVALHGLLYPQSGGGVPVDDQKRQAGRELHRIADLLGITERDAESLEAKPA